MAKELKITDNEAKKLKRLMKAQTYAEEAYGLKKELKGFLEDNEALLADGVEYDGMYLTVKYSKQLVVKEA